jgi:hypothetical protein
VKRPVLTNVRQQNETPRKNRIALGIVVDQWVRNYRGFFLVGGWEYKREFDQPSAASHFSLALLTIIALSWSAFFVFDGKARKREPMVVDVLTAMGRYSQSLRCSESSSSSKLRHKYDEAKAVRAIAFVLK